MPGEGATQDTRSGTEQRDHSELGSVQGRGAKRNTKGHWTGVTTLWKLGKMVVGETPWDTHKIVMWKAWEHIEVLRGTHLETGNRRITQEVGTEQTGYAKQRVE